ncbi:period circadian protein homolog 2 isoform X1 [Choloepus didactylus]|uniref:period circadian protein homolog 2 isoform X1 n=1 Tax=Choloepus didactylus TaxID=27675 RepID=UPI00189F827A|nr:period circadian protein homolog 2 isoform X1 [Choloepus didactylus]XP_037705179.1 period circadian protein homolog 2 isoform X1 [Choloepus didactylus]
MKAFTEFSPSPRSPSKEPPGAPAGWAPLPEDVDMSSGCSGNEANDSCSAGRASRGSDGDSDGAGKELRMLVEPPLGQSPDAFSLVMGKSAHNPSTSGCSSEQSAKADTHKELIKTLKELKVHLPADKKATGKASTLATLKYALRSVKQVKANEEYYQLLMSGEHCPSGLAVPSCTVEEIENVASEYIVKNGEMFAVAVAVATGKILYISNQVVSMFHCKKDTFTDAKFVEFLAPHDVGVFHSSTTPRKLPSWGTCRGVDSFTQECMEEKSFFCRVSAGRSHEGELRYRPFRMTPYLVRVRGPPGAGCQLGCVLLAERVHSGYEAPRIPPEKRIFTTTHTPSCLFQDVDERAVPLLGYLPQDLMETPVLLQLHPSDRPLMLAIHKKILQSGGQPFDYSPIRFRARNGEYVTLDTSWSSFINPWSRKISFIIGRHRVRVGPLNEDVFAAPRCVEEKALHPGVQELTEQIYRLLLQPVPHSGSSGYGSLGSNGSHEPLMSQTSSSDSNGHEDARRRRPAVCKNGNKAKSKSHYSLESGEQKRKIVTEVQSSSPVQLNAVSAAERDSGSASLPKVGFAEELACRDQPACSYQQISCLDSVLRYLESCSEAARLKRKCESPANIPTLNSSDKRKATGSTGLQPAGAVALVHTALLEPPEVNSHADVGARFAPLVLPGKAESMASLTSQCSYSSTIVHVGDKKPQPELEMIEDATSGAESLEGRAGPAPSRSLSPDQEPLAQLGLTKEVLAAHTLKEEQSFLHKFKEVRRRNVFQSRCHYYLQEGSKGPLSERTAPGLRSTFGIESSWKKTGKNRKLKTKRARPSRSSKSSASGGPAPPQPPLVGLSATAWAPSQPSRPAAPFPGPVAAFPLPVFPAPAAPVMAFVVPGFPFPAAPPGLPVPPCPGQPLPAAETPPGRTLLPMPPAAGTVGRASPLFQSRGSSPLQLNLLQLEEAPNGTECQAGMARGRPPQAPPVLRQPTDAHNSDALSTSSDLLDLLLNEDLCSATGSALSGSGASATSDSLGSGSLGCDAARSGTGSSDTSHTRKYFGSINSSENNCGARMSAATEDSQCILKRTLQDPVWLLMANTDGGVMMTYQMPSRNLESVLKEDREKLKLLQKFQPRFTEAQKQELREVHPWVRAGRLPTAIHVAECVYCENEEKGSICVRYKEDIPAVGLSDVTDAKEGENGHRPGQEDKKRRRVPLRPAPRGSDLR